ncbi:hypothetical protein NSE01_06750 [Novosphingobium sediminis]|uniref:Uncharacterized protein n=1 Tax=Novosphingobium sediminis TaxID=707214 RepID=A0A512AGS1_9SPHN|nr:hypothetical protein [Novosphingobium sediminis]GEN98842.1 hypothetical protein NSE01_06750 [Novosphingobium sediminis]
MIGLAMLAAASAVATFQCTFDDPPAKLSTLSEPTQAAWESTRGAAPFAVSFPVAQPDDLSKADLFAYRGDDLTGYSVETGKPGPLKGAQGPTEARRLLWPYSLRQTLENGSDHWLWVELTNIDLDKGVAGLVLSRQERPALIKPTWFVTGSCVDPSRKPPKDEDSEVDFGQ